MIGVFDYTVVLTYLSLISGSLGIFLSLSDGGHPYLGVFFLMFCGLCDAFDGKVASTKKNRTQLEKKFGIQIDSLSDLVSFGVLPACIGFSIYNTSNYFNNSCMILKIIVYLVLVFYVLAALIRLAYFNVTEEERQSKESGKRKVYIGLPVTSASIIFPSVLLLQFITNLNLTIVYLISILLVEFAFVLKFEIKKPGMKGILLFVLIGVIEFALLILTRLK